MSEGRTQIAPPERGSINISDTELVGLALLGMVGFATIIAGLIWVVLAWT